MKNILSKFFDVLIILSFITAIIFMVVFGKQFIVELKKSVNNITIIE